MRFAAAALLPALALLTGCAIQDTAATSAQQGANIQGGVRGGQQPIVGAHVYLFAANTTGYGGNGIAPSAANASISLLNSAFTHNSDSVGAYVLTDSRGYFTITGDYTCQPGQQVYILSLGGDPGAGTNSAASIMAVLGACPAAGNFLAPIPFIWIQETTTVAAAYAFAGFASDSTHVSSSGTALAKTGIANAFANAANLADVNNFGQALAVTPAGNGTAPQALVNTLANILAACVSSNGSTSTECSTLFTNAQSAGSSGTMPTDTASAAINIAHNPAANIANLFALSVPSPPFLPSLAKAPTDYTVGIQFTGASITAPRQIVIDALGNAYFLNYQNSIIGRLAPSGALLPVTGGYAGTSNSYPSSLAVDNTGNLWVVVYTGVVELAASGSYISPPQGFTGGGLNSPFLVAIDPSNNAWVTQFSSVVELSGSGTFLSGSSGFQLPLSGSSMAIDGAGSVWVSGGAGNISGVVKLSNSGTVLSPPNGYTVGGGLVFGYPTIDGSGNVWFSSGITSPTNGTISSSISELSNSGTQLSPPTGFTGGGLALTGDLAVDGGGNIWVANAGSLSEFSNQGAALSPSVGYASGLFGAAGTGVAGLAIDGSGDVWGTSGDQLPGPFRTPLVTELIGIATPVITPIAAGLAPNTANLPATTLPWTNAAGANFSFFFESSPTDGTAPIVIPTPVSGSVVTLTVTGTATVDGAVHAPGDAGPITPVLFYPGQFIPSASIVVGAFTDSSGNVLASGGPVNIGSSTVLTVPVGAAQLQLGINAYNGTFSANTGAFKVSYNVSINGSSNLGTRP